MAVIPYSEFVKIINEPILSQESRGEYYTNKYLSIDPSHDYTGCVVYKCLLSKPMRNALVIDSTILPEEADISSETLNKVLRYTNPMSEVDFATGVNSARSHFKSVTLNCVTFENIPNMGSIQNSSLTNCTFRNIDWYEQGIYESDFSNSTFVNCDFHGTNMEHCNFKHCKFIRCEWGFFDGLDSIHSMCFINDCDFSFTYFENSYATGLQDIFLEKSQIEGINVVSGENMFSYYQRLYSSP
jgi:uncharacterized protein YjbI with pentapeptide repeats